MENLRNEFKQFLMAWFEVHIPSVAQIAFDGFVVLWISVFALALHIFLHGFVHRVLERFVGQQEETWQRELLANNLFRRISFGFQGAVVQIQAGLWLEESSFLYRLIDTLSVQWILLFALLAFFSLLDALRTVLYRHGGPTNFPIRGLLQTIKLIATVLIGLLAISALMGKSPLILLSGLGALSAVLLLVFKDPILGLVAGIQLSANEMLSVGDWLEMPKYGADGDVIDIALTTVKVRNWDKTITTIPTYALISDSFKNWRGMSEAGGRRIKRSVLIETSSIGFLNEELMQRLRKADLLSTYLQQKLEAIEQANVARQTDMSVRINGRRLTNVGTFRGYLVSYLKAHPRIRQDMTLLVRQLNPSSDGLPIEIYAFTSTTDWNEYEDIQSDIFDHVFAVLPEFGLRAHESPTGHDVRTLAANNKTTI